MAISCGPAFMLQCIFLPAMTQGKRSRFLSSVWSRSQWHFPITADIITVQPVLVRVDAMSLTLVHVSCSTPIGHHARALRDFLT